MKSIVIKQANIVNEGEVFVADILIQNGIIQDIGQLDGAVDSIVIDGAGKYILPGLIDTHVHFREPGLTHKGDIYTEAKAAVAGGITSFIEMPNTIPNTLTCSLIKEKERIASEKSLANYSFYLGINTGNYNELMNVDNGTVGAITDDGLYFSGTGNMLSNNSDYMQKLFASTDSIISLHCEDESIVEDNLRIARERYGDNIPIEEHSRIRSEEACYQATFRVLEMANKFNTRLHVLHLSTGKEARLFGNDVHISEKRVTSEVCIHHLWFCDEDYKTLGVDIKWNPSIKRKEDRDELMRALNDDRIDIVSTDHAPHTQTEKQQNYISSASGGPMVQHALVAMLDLVKQKATSIEKVVEKMCHNPAILFGIEKRGFIRKGYYADLVIVDMNEKWKVDSANILYKCGWSPFMGYTFSSAVCTTIVNGHIVYHQEIFDESIMGKQLTFKSLKQNAKKSQI